MNTLTFFESVILSLISCVAPTENEECNCSQPWREMWDRYYSSGYQILDMNEGQTLIWMDLNEIKKLEYYPLALYWSVMEICTFLVAESYSIRGFVRPPICPTVRKAVF